MTRFCLVVLSFFFVLGIARAEGLNASDKSAFVTVITKQLQAFAADKDEEAYGYAAPVVKGVFPTVENFMAMVKKGYQPVYRNKGYDFGEAFIDGLGRPAQRVVIHGLDGKNYEAVYSLERQPDGTWKISGCVLLNIPGLDV